MRALILNGSARPIGSTGNIVGDIIEELEKGEKLTVISVAGMAIAVTAFGIISTGKPAEKGSTK